MKRLVLLASLVAALVIAHESRPAAQRSGAAASPQRIVSLVPATTEMMYAIGAGNRLVGVGSYDRYPPEVEKLPRLGGLLDPSIEGLLAIRPDLVIVYDTQTELQRQLERARIPTWGFSVKGLADITATVRALGERIGLTAEGRSAAATIDAGLAAIRSRVSGRSRPKTLLIFGREPGSLRGINASGGYGFLHDLLELAGGTDVLADIRQAAVAMSSEMVLARAPEVIIELHYGEEWSANRAASERRVWSALPSLPAFRSGQIHLLTGDELVVPGPRVTRAAERLAQALHPEAFR
jgi:iron complex transport system substrate-binding protein